MAFDFNSTDLHLALRPWRKAPFPPPGIDRSSTKPSKLLKDGALLMYNLDMADPRPSSWRFWFSRSILRMR